MYAAIVLSTPDSLSSRSIAGKPGRYMSIVNGPSADIEPTKTSQPGMPRAEEDGFMRDRWERESIQPIGRASTLQGAHAARVPHLGHDARMPRAQERPALSRWEREFLLEP